MIKRISEVEKLIKKKSSVLLLGPRGTGKSFYINDLLKSYTSPLCFNLLEAETYLTFLRAPGHLGKAVEYQLRHCDSCLVFVDEIQKVPSLLDEVHHLIELHKERITFILTGSSARKLKRSQANLLAGRAIFVGFYPLNHLEIDIHRDLEKALQYGTLPTAFVEEDEYIIQKYLKTYTHMYLKEEIQEESLTRNIEAFAQFIELAAFENGNPINYSKIAKQVGVSLKTIQAHYQILVDTLLFTRIPAWTNSIRKQLIQMPKYYIFDNGVLNALTGEIRAELIESSYRYGNLFENLVVNEIIRYNSLSGRDYALFHYRTNNGVEIDLIIQKNLRDAPIAIEIKSKKAPSIKDVPQFLHLREDYPDAKCYVICRTATPYCEGFVDFLPFPSGIKDIFASLSSDNFIRHSQFGAPCAPN
jgi:uncharacterized protein